MPDARVVACSHAAERAGTAGTGAVWGHAGPQLNATVLAWPAGHVVAEHVNDDREVLLVVVAGGGAVYVDDIACDVEPGSLVVIPRGARREIRAGVAGISYATAHQVRGPLQLTQLSSPRHR